MKLFWFVYYGFLFTAHAVLLQMLRVKATAIAEAATGSDADWDF